MIDLGALGKTFILGGKEGVKCQHGEKCQSIIWKCYMKLALLSLELHCAALARDLNTFADKGIHDSTKTYTSRSHHTHIALVIHNYS